MIYISICVYTYVVELEVDCGVSGYLAAGGRIGSMLFGEAGNGDGEYLAGSLWGFERSGVAGVSGRGGGTTT